MRQNLKLVSVFCVVLFMFAACSTFVSTSYKTLNSIAITVDSSMQVASDLYDQEVITKAEVEQIVALHDKYRSIHSVLVGLLIIYQNCQDAKEKQELMNSIQASVVELSDISTQIIELIRMFTNK